MPVAHFNLGNIVATGDHGSRPLIPGIDPGGSRLGQPLKPALLIQDCWIEVQDLGIFGTTDTQVIGYNLKLSQEQSLSPGLLLPIAKIIGTQQDGTGMGAPIIDKIFSPHKRVWVAKYVGVRVAESGGA